jgi:hypothetical protein
VSPQEQKGSVSTATRGTETRHFRVKVEYAEGRRPRRFLWPKRYATWVATSPDLPGSCILARSLDELQRRFFEHIRFMTDFEGAIFVAGFERAALSADARPS